MDDWQRNIKIIIVIQKYLVFIFKILQRNFEKIFVIYPFSRTAWPFSLGDERLFFFLLDVSNPEVSVF